VNWLWLIVLYWFQRKPKPSPLEKNPFGMRGLSAPSIELLYRRGYFQITLHKTSRTPSLCKYFSKCTSSGRTFCWFTFYEKDIDFSRWKYRLPSSTETSLMTEMLELETITQRAEELG
jgi:hypothetical protein